MTTRNVGDVTKRLEGLHQELARSFESYTVSVTAPGTSAATGKHAVQHVVLTSHDERIFIVGTVNAETKTAELRTLGYVLESFKKRFGEEPDIARLEYLAFLEKAQWVLESMGITVTVTAYEKRLSSAPPRARREPLPRPLLALLVSGVLLVASTAAIMVVQS